MREQIHMNTKHSNNTEEAIDASGPEPPEPLCSLEPTVTISVDKGIVGVNEDWLIEHTLLALQCINKRQSLISIRVVNDESMCKLHLEHTGNSSTTDVLTFDHGSSDVAIDADIAICKDVASRKASERNHELNSELLLYIVHGILHCAGHDDHNETDRNQMHEEEDRILTFIGVGPVWSRSS